MERKRHGRKEKIRYKKKSNINVCIKKKLTLYIYPSRNLIQQLSEEILHYYGNSISLEAKISCIAIRTEYLINFELYCITNALLVFLWICLILMNLKALIFMIITTRQ